MRAIALTLALLTVLTACSDGLGPTGPDPVVPDFSHAATPPGFPDEITVTFGRDQVGTDFFPPGAHDASFRAKDNIIPQRAHLAAGGTVVFDMGSFHAVAIYQPGTRPSDIEISDATLEDLVIPFPPFLLEDFIINDPNSRVAQGPVSFGPMQWSPPAGTFDQPGVYLVICQVLPHFQGAKMFAYIDVH